MLVKGPRYNRASIFQYLRHCININLNLVSIVNDLLLNFVEPQTEYKIFVKAYTAKHEGDPSDAIFNRTDISGPSPPIILNLTCQTQDTIFIQWARPKYFASIEYYYIFLSYGDFSYDNITLSASTEHLETSVRSIFNYNLISFFDT